MPEKPPFILLFENPFFSEIKLEKFPLFLYRRVSQK